MAGEASHADRSGPVPERIGDGDLIRRVQAGDEEAFMALFHRYETSLRACIKRILPRNLRRKVSASDLLQETRIVALRRSIEFHTLPDGTFKGWLLKILQNKVRDTIRQYRGTAKRGALDEIERGGRPDTAEFVSPQATPSQYAMASELEDRLERAMQALPEDYREILRLTRVEHLSMDEAAERIERSPSATRKLYSRSLKRFTEIYDALGGGEG